MNRSIRRLYLTLAGGFGLLVLMLGYWQVVAAEGLRDKPENPQSIQRERLVDRGRIVSADGRLLAASRARRIGGQRVFERLYPQGTLAAHVVGYSSPQEGRTGIEATWNRFLSGSFGTEPLLQRLNLSEKRGADVRVSIDTRVQAAAEQGLTGLRGAVVALDPTTGAILAMASSPAFEPARVVGQDGYLAGLEESSLLNRATAGRYPPGSTFKVVTAAAALQSGGYSPGSTFDDTGSFPTPGGPIRNFSNQTFGRHTLATALTRSINTTFARVGTVLGPEGLGDTMSGFGFGDRPPIDLPDDEVLVSGRLRGGDVLPNDERGEDAARIAIGQERLAVTPLQMAMAAGAIGNRGTLMAPRLMTRIEDRGGSVVQRGRPEEIGQVMGADNARALAEMMEGVVREGTGTAAALSDVEVTVAGKTGTAETGEAARNQAWFIGFAPSRAPRVAVAVVIEDTPGTGGVVAAPVAAQVMGAALEVAP